MTRHCSASIAVCLSLSLVLLLSGCCAPAPLAEEGQAKVKAKGPTSLFDGKSLAGWGISDIAGKGEIEVKDGTIILGQGYMTGIFYTNTLPRQNYEITLDAMRMDGSDFFCGLTFPVGTNHCSFIVGGWGGGVMGLSNIDDMDAANNDTTTFREFKDNTWYPIRVRVTPDNISSWVEGKQVVNQDIQGKVVSIRIEMEESIPLGIASWSTTAALRNIQIRPLTD